MKEAVIGIVTKHFDKDDSNTYSIKLEILELLLNSFNIKGGKNEGIYSKTWRGSS